MALTKSDLIETICAKANMTRVRAEELVYAVIDSMVEALMKDERIEIRGFGSFVNRNYDAYKGRNPRTGEAIDVSAKKLPHFKVGKDLVKKVNFGR